MIHAIRSPHNPLLAPNENNPWEKIASFNGCPIKVGDKYYLLYRAFSDKIDHQGVEMNLSTIGIAESVDGENWTNRRQFLTPGETFDRFGTEDPRVTFFEGKYYVFYTALAGYPFNSNNIKIGVAITTDFDTIETRHLVTPFNSKAMTLFPTRVGGKIAVVMSVNTDLPPNPSHLAVAYLDKIEDLWSADFWRNWYPKHEQYKLPLSRLNLDHFEVGAPPIKVDDGFLFIYSYIQDYFKDDKVWGIEICLLDPDRPHLVKARVKDPLAITSAEYEKHGVVGGLIFPSGALLEYGQLYVYYGAADTSVCRFSVKYEEVAKSMEVAESHILKMEKFDHNPLLTPTPQNLWESRAVFNPASVAIDGKVHILYRAMSQDNTSTFGYASSSDGIYLDERLNDPVYVPRAPFEQKRVPNGNSGCEDPRLTLIGDRLYLFYTAYEGDKPPRVAMSWIKVSDFTNHHFNWEYPILISPPGIDDKDSCLFPEKINGNYVIFHRIQNDIVLDYRPELEFPEGKWLKVQDYIPLRDRQWDSEKTGVNTTPIKTAEGWLVFYHGVSKFDKQYRVGVLLLELDNPAKVLAQTSYPVLEPEYPFERNGQVSNVVFPCGASQLGDDIFLYYGGADSVVCGASIKIGELLDYLRPLHK